LGQKKNDNDDPLFIFTEENMTVLFPATTVVTFKVTNKGEIVVFSHKLNVKLQNKYKTQANVDERNERPSLYAAKYRALLYF
jgi:hypothetical protein